MEWIISLGALAVSGAVSLIQIRQHFVDKRLRTEKGILQEYNADAERDSIVVAAAKEAVQMLRVENGEIRKENVRLRERIDELEIQRAEDDKVIREQGFRIARLERKLIGLSDGLEGI